MQFNDEQILDLAKPLVEIVTKFFSDEENEKKFQKWQKERRDKTDEKSAE